MARNPERNTSGSEGNVGGTGRTREEQKGGAHGYQLMLYHIVLYVSLRYIMVKNSTI